MCEAEGVARRAAEAVEDDGVVNMVVTPDVALPEVEGADDVTGCASPAPLDIWIKVEQLTEDERRLADEIHSDVHKRGTDEESAEDLKYMKQKIKVEVDIKPEVSPTAVIPTPPFPCEECGESFSCRASLSRHRETHVAGGQHRCHKCGRSFNWKANLSRHLSTSCLGPTPPTCPTCGLTFPRLTLLKSHLRRHETARPFACEKCPLTFKCKGTLERHNLLHLGVKRFPCPVCGKRFTTAALVKPHMRTHTKEKPYQCPVCLKLFSHKHNMQRHSLRHNKIKHLICDICHKQFRTESRLKYHMRVHWTDNRPFKCEHCKKAYSHKQNILRHYKKKHPNYEFIAQDTDAGLATKAWQELLNRKQQQVIDYILPELEPNGPEISVKSECDNDKNDNNGDKSGDSDEEPQARPELVFVEPTAETESESVSEEESGSEEEESGSEEEKSGSEEEKSGSEEEKSGSEDEEK